MAGWNVLRWFWPRGPARPPAGTRAWVHPSELPSFENLATTETLRARPHAPRFIAALMAVLLIVGGVVLMLNRGADPPANVPPHLAGSVSALPAVTRGAAAHIVDLSITTPGRGIDVAALVLPGDLAVTTTDIPIKASINGSTASHANFPVKLIGRDKVMGFSIVKLGIPVAALKLDPLPASTAVTVIAPVEASTTSTPEFDWSTTTLGDPLLNAQGVVRYLATKSDTSLSSFVDAVAVDKKGNVVAILSARHFWYSAHFVAEVAKVVATGHGCHADFGISGATEQGGGVLVKKVTRYSSADHAGITAGDVITQWNGANLDSWNQLASTLYLTPAYTAVNITYDHQMKVHHATVHLGCPFRLVP